VPALKPIDDLDDRLWRQPVKGQRDRGIVIPAQGPCDVLVHLLPQLQLGLVLPAQVAGKACRTDCTLAAVAKTDQHSVIRI
jgi:hypothetical protein